LRPIFRIVLAGLNCHRKSFRAPGNDELHRLRTTVERGRDLQRVQRRDPAARSRPNVDQPSAAAQSGNDYVDGTGNLRHGARHCARHPGIFGVNQAGNL